MRNVNKTMLTGILFTIVSSSLVVVGSGQATNCTSVTDLACGTNGFEILCELLEKTGLGDDLDGDIWTIFAPTNDAIENLPEGYLDSLMNNTQELTDLLLFHAVAGEILNVTQLQCGALIPMANGELSTTVCKDGSVYQAGAFNSPSELPEIITADIEVCNGIVNVISEVMLYKSIAGSTIAPNTPAPSASISQPPSAEPAESTSSPTTSLTASPTATPVTAPTTGSTTSPPADVVEPCSITEIACASEEFSILCTALTATGLGIELNQGNFTVFAPNNQAFENLGEETLSYLLQDTELLAEILMFHAVPDQALYIGDLDCKGLVEMSNGIDSRTVCKGSAIYQKGEGNPRDNMPEIIDSDIEACNGVIHVVDEVMLYETAEDLGLPQPDVEAPTSAPNEEQTTPSEPTEVPAEEQPTDKPTEEQPTDKPTDEQPTDKPTDKPTEEPVDGFCETNIAQFVCDHSQLTILCESIRRVGLDVALSGGTWTLFAPTNTAFLDLPPSYISDITDDEDKLLELLLFHTVPGKVLLKDDLPCVAGHNLIEMGNGRNSRTLCVKKVPTYQKGRGNPKDDLPKIVNFDFENCNGVVHKLDEVLLYHDIA